MIVSETKPIGEILEMVKAHRKLLVVGCGGCATVCFSGGESEVKTVANLLRIAFLKAGRGLEIIEDTVLRQCEFEYADQMAAKAKAEGVEAILSLGCGVGVNFLATKLGPIPIYPGVNTEFFGAAIEHGVWAELCSGCGDCLVHLTGGICPVTRCTKSLMNGPCGGTTDDGKCEIGPEVECGWALIIKRLKELGQMDRIGKVIPPRDWSASRHGGPRKIKKDLKLEVGSGKAPSALEKDLRSSK